MVSAPVDIVNDFLGLAVSQTENTLPRAPPPGLSHSRNISRDLDIEYDDCLAEPAVRNLWHAFKKRLQVDPSGQQAFERLVTDLQHTYTTHSKVQIGVLASDYEIRATVLAKEYEIRESVLASNYETKTNVLANDYEIKASALANDCEIKASALASNYETKANVLARNYDIKASALASNYETKANVLARNYDIKASALASNYETKASVLASDYKIKISAIANDYEIRASALANDYDIKTNVLANKYHVKTSVLENSYELKMKDLDLKAKEMDVKAQEFYKKEIDYQHQIGLKDIDIHFISREVDRLKIAQRTNQEFTGSVSRTNTWRTVKASGWHQTSQKFFKLGGKNMVPESRVKYLVDKRFPDEKHMYPDVMKLLKELLERKPTQSHPGVAVFDTHRATFLENLSPDITVALGGGKRPDSMSVYCVIELKSTPIIDDNAFGQTLDYLLALRRAQPSRNSIVALLSNIQQNHIIVLENMERKSYKIIQYDSISFAEALTFLRDEVLIQAKYFPTVPAFSTSLGTMERRLGNPRHSVVGEFKVPSTIELGPSPPRTMAVKRAAIGYSDTDIEREIGFLEKIRDKGGYQHLPQLIYISENGDEFGIAPVGKTLDPNGYFSHMTLRKILKGVLDGIRWLHSQNIVHRDIRCDNIIVDGDQAYLIDLGNAVELDGRERQYEGGYICCPVELIGDMEKSYMPKFADDYLAFLLLVSILLFPTSGAGMTSSNIAKKSLESARILYFWKGMENSPFWGRYYKAASNADGDELEGLLELFLML